jgi:hypothetical protein
VKPTEQRAGGHISGSAFAFGFERCSTVICVTHSENEYTRQPNVRAAVTVQG